jgi:hypothetical protein
MIAAVMEQLPEELQRTVFRFSFSPQPKKLCKEIEEERYFTTFIENEKNIHNHDPINSTYYTFIFLELYVQSNDIAEDEKLTKIFKDTYDHLDEYDLWEDDDACDVCYIESIYKIWTLFTMDERKDVIRSQNMTKT